MVKEEGFLSLKPMIYVANIGEKNLESSSSHIKYFKEFAKEQNFEVIEICAQLEMELAEFPEEEKQIFAKEMGIKKGAVEKLTREIFSKLNLITFFTVTGGKEIRAWALEKGSSVVEAAGKVHSDMEKGFIKAEVMGIDDLLELKSFKKAKSEGKVKLEGKDCKVKDGDVIHFNFAL